MACNFPIHGYRGKGGKITLDARESHGVNQIDIACGQCTGCRLARAQAWALRCVHEAQMYKESGKGSSFVTLTYDKSHIPAGMSLHLPDLQRFFRRMRDAGESFRYYAVGEYGTESRRPHYHALLFGLDFRDDRIPIGQNEFGDRRYISEKLTRYWENGIAELGSVSWRSAAYCSGYIVTKSRGNYDDEKYIRKDGASSWYVDKEFSVMSRRPGIGTSWYTKYGPDVFPSDFLTHDGRRRRVPRFYDRLLERDSVLKLQKIKDARVAKARKSAASLNADRRYAREFILDSNRKAKS